MCLQVVWQGPVSSSPSSYSKKKVVWFCCFLTWEIVCLKAVIYKILKLYRLQFYLPAIHRLILFLIAWPWLLQRGNQNLGYNYSATWSCVSENKKTNTTTKPLGQEVQYMESDIWKINFRKLKLCIAGSKGLAWGSAIFKMSCLIIPGLFRLWPISIN